MIPQSPNSTKKRINIDFIMQPDLINDEELKPSASQEVRFKYNQGSDPVDSDDWELSNMAVNDLEKGKYDPAKKYEILVKNYYKLLGKVMEQSDIISKYTLMLDGDIKKKSLHENKIWLGILICFVYIGILVVRIDILFPITLIALNLLYWVRLGFIKREANKNLKIKKESENIYKIGMSSYQQRLSFLMMEVKKYKIEIEVLSSDNAFYKKALSDLEKEKTLLLKKASSHSNEFGLRTSKDFDMERAKYKETISRLKEELANLKHTAPENKKVTEAKPNSSLESTLKKEPNQRPSFKNPEEIKSYETPEKATDFRLSEYSTTLNSRSDLQTFTRREAENTYLSNKKNITPFEPSLSAEQQYSV